MIPAESGPRCWHVHSSPVPEEVKKNRASGGHDAVLDLKPKLAERRNRQIHPQNFIMVLFGELKLWKLTHPIRVLHHRAGAL